MKVRQHQPAIISKVIKDIDPVDRPAYKMRQVYLHRNDTQPISKDTVGKTSSLRAKILSVSLFPNIYNSSNLVKGM